MRWVSEKNYVCHQALLSQIVLVPLISSSQFKIETKVNLTCRKWYFSYFLWPLYLTLAVVSPKLVPKTTSDHMTFGFVLPIDVSPVLLVFLSSFLYMLDWATKYKIQNTKRRSHFLAPIFKTFALISILTRPHKKCSSYKHFCSGKTTSYKICTPEFVTYLPGFVQRVFQLLDSHQRNGAGQRWLRMRGKGVAGICEFKYCAFYCLW